MSRSRSMLWAGVVVAVALALVAVGYRAGWFTTAAALQSPATPQQLPATPEPVLSRNGAPAPSAPRPAPRSVVSAPPTSLPYSMETYTFLKEKFPSSDPTSVGPNRDYGLRAHESILRRSMQSDLPYTQRELPQLLKDVIYGRVQAVIDALNAGAPVNQVIPVNELTARQPQAFSTLLSVAIDAGQREVIQALLDRGASPNGLRLQAPSPVLTIPFIAPLTLAASRGQDDVVQLLLQRGADINATSAVAPEGGVEEESPLRVAARGGEVSTTYLLLLHGADINSVLDADGKLSDTLRNPTVTRKMAIKDMLLIHGLKVAPDDSSEVPRN